jgi:hypothetical protein
MEDSFLSSAIFLVLPSASLFQKSCQVYIYVCFQAEGSRIAKVRQVNFETEVSLLKSPSRILSKYLCLYLIV